MRIKTLFFDFLWLLILVFIAFTVISSGGRAEFITLTSSHPIIMGFIKFFVLATMGELLARRIVVKKWTLKGVHIFERALVWGILGILFTYVFPIYSAGVDALIAKGMLPVFPSVAFWKSFWINILFAFPMMIFHRITDTLIDQRRLFKRWHIVSVWKNIDWDNMLCFVAPTAIWFWIPAHTVTFSLPPEFRVIMAAGLSICLGAILSFAKQMSKSGTN